MMTEQIIKISIFYNKKNWSILLDGCLLPLFSRLKKNDFISSHLILLSATDESHLRVILYTNKLKAEQAKLYFKHFTQAWIKNNRSTNVLYNEASIDRVLWMNFNFNSLHYNNFLLPSEFPIHMLGEAEVCEWLSNKVNSFIKTNIGFDVEDVLTFALSLGLAIVNRASYVHLIKELYQLIKYKSAEVELVETEAFSIQSIVEDFKHNSQAVEILYENSMEQRKSLPYYFSRYEKDYANLIDRLNFENIQLHYHVDALKLIIICCGFGPNVQLYFYVFLQQTLISIANLSQ